MFSLTSLLTSHTIAVDLQTIHISSMRKQQLPQTIKRCRNYFALLSNTSQKHVEIAEGILAL